jgi:putative addiction module component (TIGR02574 family)
MGTDTLNALLALPGPERVELAMALWQSLEATERDQALQLDAELGAELDRRWARHQQHPHEAVSWDAVRQDLGLA